MYLICRDRLYQYALCTDQGDILAIHENGPTYTETIDELKKHNTIRVNSYEKFNPKNKYWCGDKILWYYHITSIDNLEQDYPELFI